MKKAIISYFNLVFVLIMLTKFNVNAQTEWAPIGAKWYYNHYSGAQPLLTVIESIKDTTSAGARVLLAYHFDFSYKTGVTNEPKDFKNGGN